MRAENDVEASAEELLRITLGREATTPEYGYEFGGNHFGYVVKSAVGRKEMRLFTVVIINPSRSLVSAAAPPRIGKALSPFDNLHSDVVLGSGVVLRRV